MSYLLETEDDGTRLVFEHSGFDLAQARGDQAFRGAQFGWAKMLEQLSIVVADLANNRS